MFDDPYSDDGLPDNLPQEELDLVCAVPVCAGLSTATVKPSSDATQNNNQLFLLRYALQYLRPKVYVYENAPALTTNIGEKLRKTLIEE
jgi:site-specific DNA-cytosine methylase